VIRVNDRSPNSNGTSSIIRRAASKPACIACRASALWAHGRWSNASRAEMADACRYGSTCRAPCLCVVQYESHPDLQSDGIQACRSVRMLRRCCLSAVAIHRSATLQQDPAININSSVPHAVMQRKVASMSRWCELLQFSRGARRRGSKPALSTLARHRHRRCTRGNL